MRTFTPLTRDLAWKHVLPLQAVIWSTTALLFTPQVW
jgi:hypothetical protein